MRPSRSSWEERQLQAPGARTSTPAGFTASASSRTTRRDLSRSRKTLARSGDASRASARERARVCIGCIQELLVGPQAAFWLQRKSRCKSSLSTGDWRVPEPSQSGGSISLLRRCSVTRRDRRAVPSGLCTDHRACRQAAFPLPFISEVLALVTRDQAERKEQYVRDNVLAMTRKLGEVQAQLLRLDVLGERVAKAAGIRPEEFRFRELPGRGGALGRPHDDAQRFRYRIAGLHPQRGTARGLPRGCRVRSC